MTTEIQPRAKQVLVRADDEPSRVSEHGIIKPSNVEQESKAIGTVVAVGPGIEDITAGRRVIYGAFAGEKIELTEDGKDVEYVLLFDEDVLAFITEK